MTAAEKWAAAEAPEFLRYVIEEKLDVDRVHELMEEHYQRPFTTDDAATMRLAMHDAVSDR